MDIVNASCADSDGSVDMFKVTIPAFIPEHLIVFQVLFSLAFFVLFATVSVEIFFFVRQQMKDGNSLARMFCMFNKQLIKLFLLATAALG